MVPEETLKARPLPSRGGSHYASSPESELVVGRAAEFVLPFIRGIPGSLAKTPAHSLSKHSLGFKASWGRVRVSIYYTKVIPTQSSQESVTCQLSTRWQLSFLLCVGWAASVCAQDLHSVVFGDMQCWGPTSGSAPCSGPCCLLSV